MRLALSAALLTPFLIASCVPDAPTEPVTPPPLADDSCGANAYLPLIGQTSPSITVPANKAYRSYRSGDAVTTDFNPARLNFEHDTSGKLARVSCG